MVPDTVYLVLLPLLLLLLFLSPLAMQCRHYHMTTLAWPGQNMLGKALVCQKRCACVGGLLLVFTVNSCPCGRVRDVPVGLKGRGGERPLLQNNLCSTPALGYISQGRLLLGQEGLPYMLGSAVRCWKRRNGDVYLM